MFNFKYLNMSFKADYFIMFYSTWIALCLAVSFVWPDVWYLDVVYKSLMCIHINESTALCVSWQGFLFLQLSGHHCQTPAAETRGGQDPNRRLGEFLGWAPCDTQQYYCTDSVSFWWIFSKRFQFFS